MAGLGRSRRRPFHRRIPRRFLFIFYFPIAVKKAIGFLEHHDKVQVTVLFRGRENAHIDEGRKVMDGIIAQLEEYGKVESRPSQQQRRMICTIAPLKTS